MPYMAIESSVVCAKLMIKSSSREKLEVVL